MPVTIASFTFDFSRTGSTGYLRSYNTSGQGFEDPDGTYHPPQTAGGRDYMKEIAFTVASNVATVPTFTHPATWDEASGARSSVTFLILDANRQKVGMLVSDFRIPLLPSTTTWGALLTHNDNAAIIRDTNTYTKQQTDYQIAQAGLVGGLATNLVAGRVRLDTPAEDAADPEAVGTNSPLLLMGGGVVTPQQYGAVADGSSHPLSGFYDTLAEAQVDYPFATSLTQEIDYCALKAMSNAALGADGFEHADTNAKLNKPMYVPAGNYWLGDDTWLIRNASGVHIFGAGKRASKIRGNNTVLRFDGLWYSVIEKLDLETVTSTGTVCLDVDGNVPGHPYATRGVQANVFRDMFCDAALSDYCVALCRLGGSGGQGSENSFSGSFSSASEAVIFTTGFNNLNNAVRDSNISNFPKFGIKVEAGSIKIDNVAFQSLAAYQQVLNGGFDIDASTAGTGERIVVLGCDSESWAFFKGAGSQTGVLIGNNQRAGGTGGSGWDANTLYALNQFVTKQDARGNYQIWQVTTAGATGGSEPDWTTISSPHTDGSVVWTLRSYRIVDVSGPLVTEGNRFQTGLIFISNLSETAPMRFVTADYTATFQDETIFVDTSAGDVTITLPVTGPFAGFRPFVGKRYTVKKITTANSAFVVGDNTAGPDHDLGGAYEIPAGSKGFLTVQKGDNPAGNPGEVYYIVGKG